MVEHWSRKPGVVSSNLTGGIWRLNPGMCAFQAHFCFDETFHNNALQLFGNYWDHWNENKIFIPSGDRTQDLWIRKLGLGQNFEVRVGTFTKHDSQEPWTVVSKGHQARSTMHKKDFKKSQSLFTMHSSLFSSVVEHWSRKPGVVSSNLTGGIILN